MPRYVTPCCFARTPMLSFELMPTIPKSNLKIEVEKSSYCRRTIQARMQEGHFSASCKIFDDVCAFRCQEVEQDEPLDGFTGGFPCQAGMSDSYSEWLPIS